MWILEYRISIYKAQWIKEIYYSATQYYISYKLPMALQTCIHNNEYDF